MSLVSSFFGTHFHGNVKRYVLRYRAEIALIKKQFKTADFARVPPPCELDETYVPSLILAHSLHYVKI